MIRTPIFTPARAMLGLALAVVLAVGSVPSSASAQSSTPSSPDQEWTVRDTQGFRSRNLSTGPLMQIRIDGSTPSSSKSSFKRTSTDRAENQSGLDFDADYAPRQNLTLRREMRVDPKRRAVRILDIITNTEAQERSIRVDYSTSLSDRGSVRYGGVLNQVGESREYGNGVPDDTVAAVIFAERQDSQALPFFVWGQSGARWAVNIQDVGSSVSLSYEGVVPASGKVALLHWVAVAGLDKNVKLERTADLFLKDGRLVNPMVPDDIAPLVVNFTPEALKGVSATPSAVQVQPAGRLVHFDKLCGKLSVAREEKDVLWMGKEQQLRGEVTGSTVQVKMDSRTVQVPLSGIAGIRGGGGRGREHRVYLRNGAVLTGRASMGDCRLAGELGNLTLDADALELLLMRVGEADGKVPDGVAGFVELQNGAVYWLGRQEGPGLPYVTVFGKLPISLGEIWSLERRTEPPFNLIATLADGSRIHGVAQQPEITLAVVDADGKVVPTQVRVAEMVRFGSSELLSKEMALPGSGTPPTGDATKPKAEPPPRYCWLRDGSLLVGTITSPTLRVRTGGNEVDLKSEDITRMTLDAASGNVASIELRSSAKMQGELVSESFEWQLGSRKVSLPAGWVQDVVRKDPEMVPADPSTIRAPGENDPLALPKGVPKENLVEMKVDYPKAVAEGPLRVWGSLSLPRLDRCDEESVKKRLTFLVPKGTTNVALKKPVTVSAPDSALGVISTITDGMAKDDGGEQVALEGGVQWMQIDLGGAHHIWKVLLWHYHRMPVVYQDVIVRVSDDPDFRKDVKTIFNNDHDNSAGFGVGLDTAYVETNYGWLMDGAESQGRYVRFYSNGNSYSEKNDYLEAMVFGTPVAPPAVAPAPPPPKPEAAPKTDTADKPAAVNDPQALPKGMKREDLGVEKPSYPKPMFIGLPVPVEKVPNLEKVTWDELVKRSTFLLPKSAAVVSQGKPVTTSSPAPDIGTLELITDGDADAADGCYVELAPGLQWVQIDLGASHHIWKVLLWHFHKAVSAYYDVIVQVSDDPKFKTGVQTIFNNDHDNSAGFEKGPDPVYLETCLGRVIDGCEAKGRYIRFYSKGSTSNERNCYIEAMVYGTPVNPKADAPGPTMPKAADASVAKVEGPKAKATPPSAATNKPNDPDRVPTGFRREEMITRVMSAHTRSVNSPAFITAPLSKFPHLDKNAPALIPTDGQVPIRVSYPKGGDNVAQGKKVTASAKLNPGHQLQAFVDSSASAFTYIELPEGLQWMQIDLGAQHHIWKILLWHYHKQSCAVADVIVQVSDDETFSAGVTTLFNSDHDNSSGMGRGADAAYVETAAGKIIDGCDAKGRYVRFYSNGSTEGGLNRFTEAMVFGTKVEGAASGKRPETPAAPATPAPVLAMKPTPAQLESAAAHQKPLPPMALPPGIPEAELVSIRPLSPRGSPVPSVIRSAQKLDHQEEHNVDFLNQTRSLRVPKGTVRVSAGKPVTTSDSAQASSQDLTYVTDGHPANQTPPFLNLAEGLQCVQIDLLAPYQIWKVLLWHDVTRFDVYEDVIVQLSNDADFAKDVVTIFNNDVDNTSGLGRGPDPAYIETYFGRLMDGGGHTARYVRFYSRGNTTDKLNCYVEAAVYGTRVGGEEKVAPVPNEPMPTVPNHPLAPVKRRPFEPGITITPPYPKGMYIDGPDMSRILPEVPHLEKTYVPKTKENISFELPRWSYNLAKRKTVYSSAPALVEGSLSRLVDEDASTEEADLVTLPMGTQWVQVDLGTRSYIYKVLLWHAHERWNVAHDVVVQVSEDPTFASGVQTIFNNDHDNSSGLGKGVDPAYVETSFGRIIDGCDARGRYVRVTSRGSTSSPHNRFAEVMVYGKPTPNVAPGAVFGETPPLASELRAKEDGTRYSDTVRALPAYPAPAPETPGFEAPLNVDAVRFPHLEKRDWIQEHLRLELFAPVGLSFNRARNRRVSTSAPNVPEEDLQRATNGAAYHDDVVELPPGLQWVQVDLGTDCRIWNITLWHNHRRPVVYQDVVVQVSSDPKFTRDVTTVFNNDHDNSSGLGAGKDPAYVETNFGRLIQAGGALGRYVRFYSNGNSENAANHFCEAGVYGGFETGGAGLGVSSAGSLMDSMVPQPTLNRVKGATVGYTREDARYIVAFPDSGPYSVKKEDFPHLEKFDYEKEMKLLTIAFPHSVRVVRCESVSSSAQVQDTTELKRFTDSSVNSANDLELPGGLQWMQVDLGKVHELWYVRLWHQISDLVVYHDVVVQASEDPEFKTGVRTLFNNDHDNSSGLGKGTDPAYLETPFGRLIPGLGIHARYIRVYSRGNSRDNVNRFAEIKVQGAVPKDAEAPST